MAPAIASFFNSCAIKTNNQKWDFLVYLSFVFKVHGIIRNRELYSTSEKQPIAAAMMYQVLDVSSTSLTKTEKWASHACNCLKISLWISQGTLLAQVGNFHNICIGQGLFALIILRPPIESDIGLEGRILIQLSRMDYRVSWPTQREIVEHMEENKEDQRKRIGSLIREVGNGRCLCLCRSIDLLGFFLNIYSQDLFFNKMKKFNMYTYIYSMQF